MKDTKPTYHQAWCFTSEADARECAQAVSEWAYPAIVVHETDPDMGEGYDVRIALPRPQSNIAEGRAFVMGFAAARNAGLNPIECPITREAAIAAARSIASDIARNPGTLPSGTYGVSVDHAATLARYVLGLTDCGAAASILDALPEVHS